MNDYQRTMQKAEQNTKSFLERERQKKRAESVANSIMFIESDLDKYLESTDETVKHQKLDNIYYHIGVIKGTVE